MTVAVLDEKEVARVHIDPNDIDVKTCRGGGPGGQHRNTSDTAVQITHLPTGLKVRAEDNKSQHVNRENAVRLLHIRLLDAERDRMGSKRDRKRKAQVGSGMRGDKVRTVQTQNGRVTNHLNGKRIRLKEYLRGDVGALL